MKDLLVMKFGGTSMGSAERMRVAAGIIAKECAKRPVCVVVSAMSKVTDLLLDTLRHAEVGDRAAVDNNLRALMDRHVQACEDLLGEPASAIRFRENAYQAVQGLLAEFHRIANGMLMLGDRPPRSVDEAIAIGERLSSALLAEFLQASGVSCPFDECSRGHCYRRCLRQRVAADGNDGGTLHRAAVAAA